MNECMYMRVCDRKTASMHCCMEYLHFGYAVLRISISPARSLSRSPSLLPVAPCVCIYNIFLFFYYLYFRITRFNVFLQSKCLYRLQTVLLSLCVCLSIRVMYLYLLDKNETRALRSYTQRLNKANERANQRNDMLWPYVYLNIFEHFQRI